MNGLTRTILHSLDSLDQMIKNGDLDANILAYDNQDYAIKVYRNWQFFKGASSTDMNAQLSYLLFHFDRLFLHKDIVPDSIPSSLFTKQSTHQHILNDYILIFKTIKQYKFTADGKQSIKIINNLINLSFVLKTPKIINDAKLYIDMCEKVVVRLPPDYRSINHLSNLNSSLCEDNEQYLMLNSKSLIPNLISKFSNRTRIFDQLSLKFKLTLRQLSQITIPNSIKKLINLSNCVNVDTYSTIMTELNPIIITLQALFPNLHLKSIRKYRHLTNCLQSDLRLTFASNVLSPCKQFIPIQVRTNRILARGFAKLHKLTSLSAIIKVFEKNTTFRDCINDCLYQILFGNSNIGFIIDNNCVLILEIDLNAHESLSSIQNDLLNGGTLYNLIDTKIHFISLKSFKYNLPSIILLTLNHYFSLLLMYQKMSDLILKNCFHLLSKLILSREDHDIINFHKRQIIERNWDKTDIQFMIPPQQHPNNPDFEYMLDPKWYELVNQLFIEDYIGDTLRTISEFSIIDKAYYDNYSIFKVRLKNQVSGTSSPVLNLKIYNLLDQSVLINTLGDINYQLTYNIVNSLYLNDVLITFILRSKADLEEVVQQQANNPDFLKELDKLSKRHPIVANWFETGKLISTKDNIVGYYILSEVIESDKYSDMIAISIKLVKSIRYIHGKYITIGRNINKSTINYSAERDNVYFNHLELAKLHDRLECDVWDFEAKIDNQYIGRMASSP